jgi:hypothetical protein
VEPELEGVTVLVLSPAQMIIIRGRSTCFAQDVALALPTVETRRDGECLIAFARAILEGTFDIHFLEERDVSMSSPRSCSSRNQSRTRGETAALGGKLLSASIV